MVKHFFKTLTIFIGMIAVGLVGVFLVSHFDTIHQESAVTACPPGTNC